MFYKILVAVDNSPLSERVFDEAVSFAKTTGAQLILLHVLSPFDSSYLMNPVGVNYPNIYTENIQYYIEASEALKEEGLKYLRSSLAKSHSIRRYRRIYAKSRRPRQNNL